MRYLKVLATSALALCSGAAAAVAAVPTGQETPLVIARLGTLLADDYLPVVHPEHEADSAKPANRKRADSMSTLTTTITSTITVSSWDGTVETSQVLTMTRTLDGPNLGSLPPLNTVSILIFDEGSVRTAPD